MNHQNSSFHISRSTAWLVILTFGLSAISTPGAAAADTPVVRSTTTTGESNALLRAGLEMLGLDDQGQAPAIWTPATPPQALPTRPARRSLPAFTPPDLMRALPAIPTDEDLFRVRLFEEPLVPLGVTSESDNKALAAALESHRARVRSDDFTALSSFVKDNPASPWRLSVLTSLALVSRRAGYFSRSMEYAKEAWELGQGATEPRPRAIAGRALAELIELYARVGRMAELDQIFASIEGRPFAGAVAEKLETARQGLKMMKDRPEVSFRCGPLAVEAVLATLHPGATLSLDIIDGLSTTQGTSLAQIEKLARDQGLTMTAARWDGGATMPPTPAVVHWKAGHFAALTERRGTRYLVKDPTFGDETWVSEDAIRDEATGYFLVPQVPKGWQAVSSAEGATVWGKGAPAAADPNYQTPQDRNNCEPCQGMAAYQFFPLLAALGLSDIPVGYRPPVGPAVRFAISYSQREQFQPAIFTYVNIGPKWTFDWLSYVEDDPTVGTAEQVVKTYLRGGGIETYKVVSGIAPQSSVEQLRSRAKVTRLSPSSYSRTLPDGSVETFAQPDGAASYPRKVLLTEIKDPQGNAVKILYDSQFRLAAVVDAIGQVTTFSYTSGDPLKITQVTDPFGRSARLEYDSLGRLSAVTDTIGLTSRFTYGDSDFITALTTPYGVTKFEKSGLGVDPWIQATDPMGGVERYETKMGHTSVIPSTDPVAEAPDVLVLVPGSNLRLDTAVTFHWNKRLMALAPGDYSKAEQIHWAWNANSMATGIVRARKQPLEQRVWYNFKDQTVGYRLPNTPDASALPTKIARKLDATTDQVFQYEYNNQGMVLRSIDPLGREMQYTYDPANGIDRWLTKRKEAGVLQTIETRGGYVNHRPGTITDRSGDVTTFTYNARGQVATVRTPPPAGFGVGPLTTYNYDTYGFLASIQGPVSGAQTSFTYDGVGRTRSTTDATGYMTTMEYDPLDRVVKVTHPDTTYEAMEYERLDMTGRRDRLGRWTRTAYDPLRRAISVKDANNGTTSYLWCDCGTMDGLIDANGNKTSWEYDLQSRVLKETRADNRVTSYTYEPTTSRLKTRTDRRGVTTNYAYFVDNQLNNRAYSSLPVTVAATPTLSYTYHADTGLPLTAANGTDTLTWTYDNEDRMSTEASALNATTVGWTYDGPGNRSTVTLGGSTFNSYGYDVTSRLKTITHGALVFGFDYDTPSRRALMTYPNGINTTYTYDAESRLTQINAKLGSTTDITKFDYDYDDVGNRRFKNTLEFNENYTYDALDRLTTATRPGGTTPSWLWTYDKVGNRLVDQKADTSGVSASLSSYNTTNQLMSRAAGGSIAVAGSTSEVASVSVNAQPAPTTGANTFQGKATVSGSSPQQFTVQATDPSGNVRTSTYSVNVSAPGGATFTYDENGNTTQKVEGGDTWVYVWDAENRLVEVKKNAVTQATFRYDPMDRRVEKAAGGTTFRYVYDNEDWIRRTGGTQVDVVHGPGIDEPLAQDSGGAVTYFHADALGSVQKHTSAAGAVVQTIEYDAWGNALSGTPGAYGFTSREPDLETGLQYYRARYYDARAGRFLREDPLGTGALTASNQSPNLFQYAENNPVRQVDPSGLISCVPTGRTRTWDSWRVDAEKLWVLVAVEPPAFGSMPMSRGNCVWKKATNYIKYSNKVVEELCLSDSAGCAPAFFTQWAEGGRTEKERSRTEHVARSPMFFVAGSYYCMNPNGGTYRIPFGGPLPWQH